MSIFILSAVTLLMSANAALAQDVDVSNSVALTAPPISETEEEAADFTEEGLADSDLEVDLAAESLPTTDAWSFQWESMRDRIAQMFTFNIEKKSQLMRERLHRLDRKIAACAEIGDEKCLEKVEELRQKVTARTEAYIQKKEALRERLLEKFQAWREKREAKEEAWRERVQQKKDNKLELVAERQANRKAARERRQESRRENLEQRQGQKQLNLEQRQQNREQLIEMRSDTLKSKLDATRLKVGEREQLTEKSGE